MIEVSTPLAVSIVDKMNEGINLTNGLGSMERDKNVDSKELADRIAAAEAMSCLSSLVLLPSNAEEYLKLGNPNPDHAETKIQSIIPMKQDKNKSSPTKRGKTKEKGGQQPANRKRDKHCPKTKGKTKVTGTDHGDRNSALVVTTHVSSVNQNATIMNSSKPIPLPIQMALLSKLKPQHLERQTSNNKLELTTTPSDNLILKLPLLLSGGTNPTDKGTTTLNAEEKVTKTDSVELTQSTVDRLIQQPLPSKFQSVESALPLKKRRILAYQESLQNMSEDVGNDLTTDGEEKTESENPVCDINSGTSAPSQPKVNVDPRTSLLLLSEMQMALHQDEDGDLPLHIAVAQENIVMVNKFVHLMSISGKSVDKYNKGQQTPLHLAVELDFTDAVKTLLQAGANPNLVNKRGENSIHLAVKLNSESCLATIINFSRHKSDLNTRNFEGLAPLHTATIKKLNTIVQTLIEAGADINLQDGKSGRTPLFYAVEHDARDLIQLYQCYGANIDLPNYAGITAILAAQARGYHQAASILLKGLDAKALAEHPQREALACKKIPIPRIPSKSHLIVAGSKTSKPDKSFNQNSDSNDSQEPGSSQVVWTSILQNDRNKEPMDVTHPQQENDVKVKSENMTQGTQGVSVTRLNTETTNEARVKHPELVTSFSVKEKVKTSKPSELQRSTDPIEQKAPQLVDQKMLLEALLKTPQALTVQQQQVLKNLFVVAGEYPQPPVAQVSPLIRQREASVDTPPATSTVTPLQLPTTMPFTQYSLSPVTSVPMHTTVVLSSAPQTEVTTVSPPVNTGAPTHVPLNAVTPMSNPVTLTTSAQSSSLVTNSTKSSNSSQTNSRKRHSDKSCDSKNTSKSQAAVGSSSKGGGASTTSQPYHLTNISRATASILAAKLQGTKNSTSQSPLNLTKSIPEHGNHGNEKEENL